MRVLFATAELAPLARVGGLAEAASGLVRELRRIGVDVEVVLPDYDDVALDDETVTEVALPHWASGRGRIRSGRHPRFGEVTLVDVDDEPRPHPYTGPDGREWPGLDRRFFSFSSAVAALVLERRPDVLHLNDWHTAPTLGLLAPDERPPTVLTLHTLGYQGLADRVWLDRLDPSARAAFEWYGACNSLLGSIRLADSVIAVSPTYAREILTEPSGAGLHGELAARGAALLGIRNGIDTAVWDPSTDALLPATYRASRPAGRDAARVALCDRAGWTADDGIATIGVVSRLVDQKGIDLVIEAVPFLDRLPARLFVLGAGDPDLADALTTAQSAAPGLVHFVDGYDATLAHLVFAGCDLFAMPSRFEPCGLAQMQAMAYGAIPVVTDVGGLHDTVVDADADPDNGTGIVIGAATGVALVDGLHRGVRLWRDRSRRRRTQRRGMTADWSWTDPARQHFDVYETLTSAVG